MTSRRTGLPPLTAMAASVLGAALLGACRSSDPAATPTAPRVICGTLTCAEVALDLGADNVIAWTPIALDERYSLIADRLVGRDIAPPDAEGMAAFRPTLVVTASFSRPETLTQLERLGIPSVRLPSPETLDDIWDAVGVLGDVLERKADAAALIGRAKSRLDALTRQVPLIGGRKPRVLAWFDGTAPAARTTVDLAISAAGFQNATSGDGWVTLDAERVVAAAPDVVVLSKSPGAIERLRENPALARWVDGGGKVILIPGPLLGTTSHQLVDLAENLQAELRSALSTQAPP
ncbi:MAG: ABC transporter substrate-binding protein [Myxococcales bacterium]|nr:ABC transporter substrate-binding protein [Myxococcales bacterium]